jgi:hypothetical protein
MSVAVLKINYSELEKLVVQMDFVNLNANILRPSKLEVYIISRQDLWLLINHCNTVF